MAGITCPKHGPRIAVHFCPHALAAVSGCQPLPVFLRKGPYAWHTLCEVCVRNLPASLDDADQLACSGCVIEWATATGSDYVDRARNPVDESPPDEDS